MKTKIVKPRTEKTNVLASKPLKELIREVMKKDDKLLRALAKR